MAVAHWISVAEAAARLGVTRMTVYDLIFKKKLKGKKFPPFNLQVVDAASVEKQRKERTRAGR
jgi:transposase